MQATAKRHYNIAPVQGRTYTPWGLAEHVTPVADGIVFVSTRSHGGYWLSVDRWDALMARYPHFAPFGDNTGWLEEDCDWRMACFMWPELFPADAMDAALNIQRWYDAKQTA